MTKVSGQSVLSHAERRIAVSGTHRSSTTVIGNILAADPDTMQLVEPFTKGGLAGMDHWFPNADRPDTVWQRAIDRFLLAGTRFNSKIRPVRSRVKHIYRHIRPNQTDLEYLALLKAKPSSFVLKDPFVALASRHLITRHHFKVLFTIKHPAAFYHSLMRVGWQDGLPLDDLESQGVIASQERVAAATTAAQAGLFWRAINAHALETVKMFPEQARFLMHEDFCAQPVETIKDAAAFVAIPFGQDVQRYVATSTSGEVVAPDPLTVHHFVRNAKSLPQVWQSTVSAADQRTLRELTEPLYSEIYRRAW